MVIFPTHWNLFQKKPSNPALHSETPRWVSSLVAPFWEGFVQNTWWFPTPPPWFFGFWLVFLVGCQSLFAGFSFWTPQETRKTAMPVSFFPWAPPGSPGQSRGELGGGHRLQARGRGRGPRLPGPKRDGQLGRALHGASLDLANALFRPATPHFVLGGKKGGETRTEDGCDKARLEVDVCLNFVCSDYPASGDHKS